MKMEVTKRIKRENDEKKKKHKNMKRKESKR
jgi:hypothetical protein